MVEFEKDFLWGAATSAYQVEGNNARSDWWEWEKRVGLKEKSSNACRHYELFRDDFNLAQQLNHNTHRISIEWSRIQPEEGNFAQNEIDHYLEVIAALQERNLEPVVTLHHFTNPIWFSAGGGWLKADSVKLFSIYVKKIVDILADKVHFWVTINEPMVYIYESYIIGAWPPQEKSFLKAKAVADNLGRAHIQAYKIIRDIYLKKKLPRPMVSIAHNMRAFVPCNLNFKNRIAVRIRDKYFNFAFLERLIKFNSLDFIGLNYYSRDLVDITKWGISNLLFENCAQNHSPVKKNSLGWDIYPQGLYSLLKKLKKYSLPVFILENGICTDDDSLRWEFIREHLKSINLAIKEGVKVLGYIYWSLLDNFEWDKGFGPRFGLIEVDYLSYKRTVKDSAKKLAQVIKAGEIE